MSELRPYTMDIHEQKNSVSSKRSESFFTRKSMKHRGKVLSLYRDVTKLVLRGPDRDLPVTVYTNV